jgi:hypothetical protein
VFFSKDLIELVNKTNNRLLYCDLLSKKSSSSQPEANQSQQDYQLLNAFEMLWNIENTQMQGASQQEKEARFKKSA